MISQEDCEEMGQLLNEWALFRVYFSSFFLSILYRWPAICIHGDKAQQEREWVLEGKRFYNF